MLEGLKRLVKKVIGLFSVKEIKDVFHIDAAITGEMQHRIQLWHDMYSGKAYWINEDVFSLRLEQGIVREFANIVLTEMTVSVSNEKLKHIFDTAVRDLNENLQLGLATGAMIIKPLGTDGVQYVAQNSFIPVEYDSEKRLIKVIFPDIRQTGEYEYLIRLEYHSVSSETGLTIINKVFKSSSPDTLGKECPLSVVEEWKNLPEKITYPNMKRPAFGYYRNPIANTIDGSSAGVSLFESAVDMIHCADKQFGRLEWEFESGERAVHVDEAALNLTEGQKEPSHTFKRLYRGFNTGKDDLFDDYSPEIRQADISKGLEDYKRQIEFQVCLSYGDLSNPQTVEKTAQEVRIAKKRKYNMVNAIQKKLRDCLDDLCYALAFYNALTTSGYELVCDFKDSILTDEQTERQQDIQDVSIGVMPLWEYRMKWYGEDEKTARKMTEDSRADVIE